MQEFPSLSIKVIARIKFIKPKLGSYWRSISSWRTFVWVNVILFFGNLKGGKQDVVFVTRQ